MRKFYSLFLVALFTANLFAQVPQKMSYQAIIRNSDNALITNHEVGMRVSILQGSATGTPVYVETQTTMTNANGLASIEIGGGVVVTGSFEDIEWSSGLYFIKTETDPTGGTSYTIAGTSQLLSVPYALHAKTAATADYNSLSNLPVLNTSNWNTAYSWGNHATAGYLTSGSEGDGVIGNEINNVTNTTLVRGGAGTSASPFTVGLNLANINTWTASQSFNSDTYFPGSGIWNASGNVGIGTANPTNKLQIQNGNMVIDRALATSVLSLGTVAGVTGRIFAGDAGGGSLNTNYNQIKMTANPNNSEELMRLHTGADAMSNTGTVALYFGQFNLMDMAAIKAVNEGGQPLNRTAGLSFWTEPAGTGLPLQERMRITGSGNVGIGITTPGTKLVVDGVITATGGNSTDWNLAYGWGNHSGLYRPITYVPSWNEISDKPSFALVATTGSYNDLSGKPLTDGSETKISAGNNIAVTGTGTSTTPYIINIKPHIVGESYGGGIVFYVYDDGLHGLIAAAADGSINGNPNLMLLYNGPIRVAGAFANGVGAGKENTSAIIAMQAALTPAYPMLSTMNAAYAAVNYSAQDANGVRYGDWYLPSQYEMVLMSNSTATIPGYNRGNPYWSSTEVVDNVNYAYMVVNGSLSVQDKRNSFRVRPIRAF